MNLKNTVSIEKKILSMVTVGLAPKYPKLNILFRDTDKWSKPTPKSEELTNTWFRLVVILAERITIKRGLCKLWLMFS